MSSHGHAVDSMNQWVASFENKAHGQVSDKRLVAELGADATEPEELFFSMYLSLQQIVVRTIADGDCALDVMSLMRGWPRTLASREQTRLICSLFARSHVGN